MVEPAGIGWVCPYVPQELFMAAGLDSARLLGLVDGIREADAFAPSNLCPFIENLLESGLENRFGSLSGIVFANTCDGMRRLYDLWLQHVDTPFIHLLEIPKNRHDAAVEFYHHQLILLQRRLEEHFGVQITPDKLRLAIDLKNNIRVAMHGLFSRQKSHPLPIKGSHLLRLSLAADTSPTTETLTELTALADGYPDPPANGNGPSILVAGSRVDRPVLFEMVEDAGASVAAFDTCFGLKHFEWTVENGPDPLFSLAGATLLRPPCPHFPGLRDRLARLAGLIDDYSVQGVIFSHLKYCDYNLFDIPSVESLLREKNIPLLLMENAYTWTDAQRARVRVEAFLEVVAG